MNKHVFSREVESATQERPIGSHNIGTQNDPSQGLILLIVPPFFPCHTPSLAAGILKSSVEREGMACQVFYANLLFLEILGDELFEKIGAFPAQDLIIERIFASSAHDGMPRLSLDQVRTNEDIDLFLDKNPLKQGFTRTDCLEIEEKCALFLRKSVEKVSLLAPRIIGFSNGFQQINSSIALVKGLKRVRPDAIYVMGGINCSGVMGEEISRSIEEINYLFQGEADSDFAVFCRNYMKYGRLPEKKIIQCQMPLNLNSLPVPDYKEYFDQLGDRTDICIGILFESSRGCWWGEKHKCKFCAENGPSLVFREKSADRVLEELNAQRQSFSRINSFCATDAIFPRSLLGDFLKKLADSDFKRDLVYQVKANLSHGDLLAMKGARITRIQAGIESLSTRLLHLMNKGTTAAGNIRFLRDCRELGLNVIWNILTGFPHDRGCDYYEQAEVIPFITHFSPPTMMPVVLRRHSEFFEESDKYGLRNIRPVPGYRYAFPDSMNIDNLAFFFDAEFPSESQENPDVMQLLRERVNGWCRDWMKNPLPGLLLKRVSPEKWLVEDSRGCAIESSSELDMDEYSILNRCRIPALRKDFQDDRKLRRLIRLGYLIQVDGKLLSVVCNSPEKR